MTSRCTPACSGEAGVVVAANFGRRSQRVAVPLPHGGAWRNVVSQEEFRPGRDGKASMLLAPGQALVLSHDGDAPSERQEMSEMAGAAAGHGAVARGKRLRALRCRMVTASGENALRAKRISTEGNEGRGGVVFRFGQAGACPSGKRVGGNAFHLPGSIGPGCASRGRRP
jgi:hypothetical protein